MPTPRRKETFGDSQYQSDFRPRRYPRQVAARPTSASRRNNPHPVQDFLLYRPHNSTSEEEVQSLLRAAILRSAPALAGGRKDLNAIPVGPLNSLGDSLEAAPYSQLPVHTPRTDRPRHSTRLPQSPRLPASARNLRQHCGVADLLSEEDPCCEKDEQTTMAAKQGDREIIMRRGLSPRRAAPRSMPGKTMSHYGSFGNRETPNPYIGALDLYASPYNANRGFNQGFTDYSSRVQPSRPMHRHVRPLPKGEDYLHNNSIYYSTTPNVSGYFIIHPDWVSERLTLKRSQSLLSF